MRHLYLQCIRNVVRRKRRDFRWKKNNNKNRLKLVITRTPLTVYSKFIIVSRRYRNVDLNNNIMRRTQSSESANEKKELKSPARVNYYYLFIYLFTKKKKENNEPG